MDWQKTHSINAWIFSTTTTTTSTSTSTSTGTTTTTNTTTPAAAAAPTTTVNAKINEVKSKIPNITNIATTIALTAVENKMPTDSNLVKKTDYNTKISEIENKITTDYNQVKYVTTK